MQIPSCTIARALELDSKYVKAYFRRGTAHLSIMKPQLAIKDFRQVCHS